MYGAKKRPKDISSIKRVETVTLYLTQKEVIEALNNAFVLKYPDWPINQDRTEIVLEYNDDDFAVANGARTMNTRETEEPI